MKHLLRPTIPNLLIASLMAVVVSPAASQTTYDVPVGPVLTDYWLWSPPAGLEPGQVQADGGELVIEAGPGEGFLFITRTIWTPASGDRAWVRADVSVTGAPAHVAAIALVDNGEGPTGDLSYHEIELLDEEVPLVVGQQSSGASFRAAYQIRIDGSIDDTAVVRLSNMQVVFGSIGETADFDTGFDGDFNQPPENAFYNINGDKGRIGPNPDDENILVHLDAEQAANIAIPVQGGARLWTEAATVDEPRVLQASLFAQLDLSGDREPEPESELGPYSGLAALVLSNGTETLGTFHAIDAEQPNVMLRVDGNVLHGAEFGWVLVGQLYSAVPYAGAEAYLDSMRLQEVDGSSIPIEPDLSPRPTPTPDGDANTEAVLTLPYDTTVGGLLSIGLSTLERGSLQPAVREVRIELLRDGLDPIPVYDGLSGADGRADAQIRVPNLPSGEYTVRATVQGVERPLQAKLNVREGAVIFVETDKPIYKPGQTIHGRLVSLNNELKPQPQAVEVTVTDGKGIRIFRRTVETNQDGVGAFDLPLASELNLGTWRIQASAGDSLAQLDVLLDLYVLPRFEVQFDTEKNWFLVNEAIQGAIQADYFFGQPVQGTYAVQALRYVGTWEPFYSGQGAIENGAALVDIPAVSYVAGTYSDEAGPALQLNLTVTDDSGHEESTSQLFDIVDSPLRLKMIPESKVIKPGLPLQILAISEDPDGRPLDAELQLEVNFWDDNVEKLGQHLQSLSTAAGLALFDVEVPVGTAIAQIALSGSRDGYDTKTNEILYGAASPTASFIHLRQRSDAPVHIGELIEFDVLRTGGGSTYYDVVALGRTVQSGVVSGSELSFTVTPEMAPSMRVLIYAINPNGEISADALPVDVEGLPDTGLAVQFDRDQAEPGESLQVSITAGQRSTVGVAIVDSSVFALAQGRLNLKQVFDELQRVYMDPKIEIHGDQNLFPEPIRTVGGVEVWDDVGLQVRTSPNLQLSEGEELNPWLFWFDDAVRRGLPIDLQFGVPEVVDFEGAGRSNTGEEPTRVRQFFPETWVWQPLIATGDDGTAALDLEAPDSITTWKLHAVANNADGIGITEDELTVFQPFFIEPDLPYAVIRGDEFPLLVQVFNYSETDREVEISLDLPEGIEILEETSSLTVTVPSQSVRGVTFRIRPTQVGLLPFQVTGIAGSLSDAVRKPLRVEPEGARRDLVRNGVLTDGAQIEVDLSLEWETPVARPEEDLIIEPPVPVIVPDSTKRRISITPSFAGSVMENLDDLVGMPYGCGEQNMIFLAPDVEVLRYIRATNQIMPELQAKAEMYVTVGYQRELTYRHDDGSFSAFGESDDSGSLWLSAFVLSVFSAARDVYDIDDSVLSSCASWIVGHQQRDGGWEPVGTLIHQEMDGGQDGKYTLSAYVALALATYGQADTAAMSRAEQYLVSSASDVNDSPYGLALGATALDAMDSSAADGILDRLMELAIRDDDGLHWDEQAVETTAYASMALLGRFRPEASDCLRWLVAQRGALGGYNSTQDTVVAFKALTMAAIQQTRDLDAEIDILVGEELIHTFQVGADNFDILQTFELDEAIDRVTLRQRGSGSVTYQGHARYNVFVPEEPSQEGPMLLSVEYLADHVEVDDIVDVVCGINYVGPLEKTGMIIVDVSVPTGFEPVQDSLTALLVENGGMVSRIEQPGRKMVFYLNELLNGTPVEFRFQVKALYPVRASVGTSSAYDYYDPAVRAEIDGGQIEVGE